MNRLINPFVRFFERWMPDTFIFAVGLTMIVLVAVPVFTETSFMGGIQAWGGGFWNLLEFTTQIATTLVTGYALANTPIVNRNIKRLANIPRNAFQVYALTSFVALTCNLISWSLGLIAGAVLAKEMATVMRSKGIKIHYPLLVASAYTGFVIWELGLTSSIALSIATPGHPFEDLMGIVPISETIFTPWNITIAILIALTVPIIMAMLHPKDGNITQLKENVQNEIAVALEENIGTIRKTPAELLENSKIFNWIMGSIGIYIVLTNFEQGITLNLVNLLFLSLTILLSQSPIQFVNLIYDGAKTVGSIILQYPFYAGIMGIIATTGLGNVISEAFIRFSTVETLPFWTFISAGVLNIFVPSGGAQWAVQGTFALEAAKSLGVDPSHIAMAVSYGDEWTNMLQPFWTLPILAIAGLHVRDIMGYLVAACIWTGLIFSIGLLIIS